MIHIPEQFRPHINTCYPDGNCEIFEEWFHNRHHPVIKDDREYLPIFWTSYYVNHSYGKDQKALTDLQSFIDGLDKSKKYFTLLQYDDGIINDLSGLDIKVFGSGGGRIDSPIALLTAPHPFQFRNQRNVFCSFAGSMTHPIRKQIMQKYRGKFRMYPKPIPIKNYCELLSKSVFHACPRGYGLTSFRICEALQYGAIPVYISDEFIIPYGRDFNEYGVIIHADQVNDIDKILRSFTREQIEEKQQRGLEIYNELYTFEGARKWILENI